MKEPLISVIVPVYNVEKYLNRCIESIVQQTYQNIEIMLMDDDSPDNCGSICDAWKEKDSRIRVFHLEHGGISATRNSGLKEANGEYIVFVDSDDYMAPDLIDNAYNNIKKYEADMVIFEFVNFYEDKPKTVADRNKSVGLLTKEQILYKMYGNRSDVIFLAWNKLYKREIFEGVRYPEGRIYEDNAIGHKIIEKCNVIVYDESQYYYRQMRPNSIMGQSNISFTHKNMQVLYGMKERCELYHNLSDKVFVSKVYAQYFHTLIECAYKTFYYLNDKEVYADLKREFCEIYDRVKKEIKFDVKKTMGYFGFRYFPRMVIWLMYYVRIGKNSVLDRKR